MHYDSNNIRQKPGKANFDSINMYQGNYRTVCGGSQGKKGKNFWIYGKFIVEPRERGGEFIHYFVLRFGAENVSLEMILIGITLPATDGMMVYHRGTGRRFFAGRLGSLLLQGAGLLFLLCDKRKGG